MYQTVDYHSGIWLQLVKGMWSKYEQITSPNLDSIWFQTEGTWQKNQFTPGIIYFF